MSWLSDLLFRGVDPQVVAGSYSAKLAASDPFKLPTVVAARQLIADTVSQFPLTCVVESTGKRIAPTPSVLRRPNPAEPPSDTFERIVNSLTRHGNAVLRVTAVGSEGYPIALEVVDFNRCSFELTADGVGFAEIQIDGIVQDRRLVQVVPFILESGPLGRSPLVEINEALNQLSAAMTFSATYYNMTASTPPFALISPTRLQADKAGELLDTWMMARDQNRPAVISGGLTLETYDPVSASDALVLDAIRNLDSTVARVMQCPPSLLNTEAQSSLTYSTVRDEYRKFLLTLNASYLNRIEAAFSQYRPNGQIAQFDTASLTRLDQSEQLDFDVKAIAAGIYTANEVRANRGLDPLDVATDERITDGI